jgi:hypothetical protein
MIDHDSLFAIQWLPSIVPTLSHLWLDWKLRIVACQPRGGDLAPGEKEHLTMVCKQLAARLLVIGFVTTSASPPLFATHILIPDFPGFRRPQLGEGYLKYKPNPMALHFGDEWTGWVDVRHPSLAGQVDQFNGYDRSDRSVGAYSHILVDRNGVVSPEDRATDFHYMNRAYMLQAGVSIIETGVNPLLTSPVAGMPGSFDFPLSHDGQMEGGNPAAHEEEEIMTLNNAAVPAMNIYYAKTLLSGAYGETHLPNGAPGGNDEAIFMANVNLNGTPGTLAHESYHFLGDGLAIHDPDLLDDAHSTDPRNIVGGGPIQWDAGMQAGFIGANNPPWNIPLSTTMYGPNLATADGTPGGEPRIGGFMQLTGAQAERLFAPNAGITPNGAEPYLQRGFNARAADRVDFDFVADSTQITDLDGKSFGLDGLANGADNHGGALDSLYFEIAGGDPTIPSPQAGKDKSGMGVFPAMLDFAGPNFRFVDVFSMALNYADSDYDLSGTMSHREKALDYNLLCRAADGSTIPGVPMNSWIGGWAEGTYVDDYLARWRCDNVAVGVLIFAEDGPGHDGLAQIDAVIVAVPEPTCLLPLLLCTYVLRKRR